MASGGLKDWASERLVRSVAWAITRVLLRVRIVGEENIPRRGPALLVANHVSHLDPLLIGLAVPPFSRFLVYRPYYERAKWLFRLLRVIPISEGTRRDVVESLKQARVVVEQGGVVGIFAEGAISRTGNLLPFRRGFERIVRGLEARIVPVYLDGFHRAPFSFDGGRLVRFPRRLRHPVTVYFGPPLPATATVQDVRQAVMELGVEAARCRRTRRDLLHLRFIATAKRRWFSLSMADSSGRELTYGRALAGSLLLARWLRRQRPGERMIGVLLPASVGGALANIATLLAGRIPVNLNFTAGREAMASAVEQCDVRTILTSRVFLTKANLSEMEGMVYLEDVMSGVTRAQKAWAGITALLTPARLLQRRYGRKEDTPDSLATVIFSSGSTGVPKGVMLSHHNVLANVEALARIFYMTPEERIMGVLPFFHVFGFTCTLWFPLMGGCGVAYHPNPTDAKTIGEMVQRYRACLLMATPTFYATYIRRCTREEFASLRYAIVGGEKLQPGIAGAFREKYGLDLLEGYGVTETSPVVAVNVPDFVDAGMRQTGFKAGAVGHPIPGVAVKIVHPATGEPLGADEEGLLLVKGPGCMMGYLGQPERTAEVMREGWYVTGDIGAVDEDGFLRITDRLSRFSKIGGEMVPHVKVEEVMIRVLEGAPCAVTAVADEQRGERLVALYTRNEVTPTELWSRLNQSELPKLWIPKRENLYPVDELPPALGSGKMDLRRL
ncbi:MAG: AMP-binding protein, partial [Acidobacteriota bacterium]